MTADFLDRLLVLNKGRQHPQLVLRGRLAHLAERKADMDQYPVTRSDLFPFQQADIDVPSDSGDVYLSEKRLAWRQLDDPARNCKTHANASFGSIRSVVPRLSPASPAGGRLSPQNTPGPRLPRARPDAKTCAFGPQQDSVTTTADLSMMA